MIGSSTGTNCSSSSATPCASCVTRVIAMSVSHHVLARSLANGQRRRRSTAPRVVVADVEHLARRIAHRIVRPGGEQVLLAVDGPRAARARLGHEASEVRVGEHVDPRRRRPLPRAEDRHVLPPVGVEAAEAVEEFESPGAAPPARRRAGAAAGRGARSRDRDGVGAVGPRAPAPPASRAGSTVRRGPRSRARRAARPSPGRPAG